MYEKWGSNGQIYTYIDINEDPKLYEKYQLCYINYEESKREITLKTIKIFLNIKNPSKLEENIGIIMMYFIAYMDKTIHSPLKTGNIQETNTNFILENKSWTYIVSSLKKISMKKIFHHLK